VVSQVHLYWGKDNCLFEYYRFVSTKGASKIGVKQPRLRKLVKNRELLIFNV